MAPKKTAAKVAETPLAKVELRATKSPKRPRKPATSASSAPEGEGTGKGKGIARAGKAAVTSASSSPEGEGTGKGKGKGIARAGKAAVTSASSAPEGEGTGKGKGKGKGIARAGKAAVTSASSAPEETGKGKGGVPTGALLDKLRVPEGAIDLGAYDAAATPGFKGGKAEGKEALAALGGEVSDWQERLYAEGRKGGNRSVLLVLQGMDTSGKGGVIRHGAGLMDPQGLRLASFKAPTPAEKRRGFLWRIRQAVPGPGYIGIFDRSHYEDVLIARVRNLVSEPVWTRRYGQINDFEAELAANGVTILKCFLHISAEEQENRLMARLDDPTKHWKYNPADVDERQFWPDYTEAYQAAIERCNLPVAPWYVIPSDRKWYRNWAVTTLLLETLRGLDPQWPKATFDVENEKRRLLG